MLGWREVPCPEKEEKAECPFVAGTRVSLSMGEVNYRLEGPPSPAPLVVIVHGLSGSMASFEVFRRHLLTYGLRVLVFDLFGFGLSSAGSSTPTHETYSLQLYELLECVEPKDTKACIIGYSIGGIIAIEFARRHPERVSRLLLIAPAGLLQKAETPCGGFVHRCLRTRFGGCPICISSVSTRCCEGLCRSFFRRKLRNSKHVREFCTPDVQDESKFGDIIQANVDRFVWDAARALRSYLRVLRHMPLWEDYFEESYAELARGPIPVLFLWGTEDCVVPWEEVEHKIMHYFGPCGVSCIFFPRVGHGILIEIPTQIASCTIDWVLDSQDSTWQATLHTSRLLAISPINSSSPPLHSTDTKCSSGGDEDAVPCPEPGQIGDDIIDIHALDLFVESDADASLAKYSL